MYKMSVDGTQKTKLNNEATQELYVTDQYIYSFSLGKVNRETVFKGNITDRLCRYNLDRTDEKIIYDYWFGFIEEYDGNIYFADCAHPNGFKLFKVNMDGSDMKTVYSEPITTTGSTEIQNGYLYYQIKPADQGDAPIYRIKLDGTDKKILINRICSNFEVYRDWIFYTSKTGDEWCVYRAKTDGTNNQIFRNGLWQNAE